MILVIAGMIGLGKTTVTDILAKELGTEALYEDVKNPILEKFYVCSEKEILEKRYPFLLQLSFLNSRYRSIKKAMDNDNNILDRSIYEDKYFMERNKELGKISEDEAKIYCDLLDNMMEELEWHPKKSPDLLIYLKGDFDIVLERIFKRGRSFEVDPSLIDYYRFLHSDYDRWIKENYTASQVLVVDMNKMDVTKEEDRLKLCKMVQSKLKEIRG